MTCLEWACIACKTKGKGGLPIECPNCGTRGAMKQSCSKNCTYCETARGQDGCIPEYLRIVDSSKEPAACMGILPTTKKPTKIDISRNCMCGEKVKRELKTLAECITVLGDRVTTPLSLFSSIVSSLSNSLAPEFQLYNNATAFFDVLGNTTAVFMTNYNQQPLEMAHGEIQLRIVVRGVMPELWVDTLPELATLGIHELHCPICAISATQQFVPLKTSQTNPQQLQCSNGHSFPLSGMLVDAL